MAKLCSTTIIAAALFCLFTISLGRALLQNDESTTQVSLPISESTTQVSLPSSESTASSLHIPSEPVESETDSKSDVVSSVLLTRVSFRPINRRFRVKSKHPCPHHFRFHPKMRENEEISYGNDMLVSSGENSDFEEPVVHGEGQWIPRRWVRLHHHRDEDSDSDSDSNSDSESDSDSDDDDEDDRVKKIGFKRYDHGRFDRKKKFKFLKKLRKQFQNKEEEKKKKDGFWRGVRKFLDHYF